MICIKYLLVIFAITPQFFTVKVNMEGSLRIGKDVMDTIKHYLKDSPGIERRTMTPIKDSDAISFMVRSSFLCRDLTFCEHEFSDFINEYIITQAKAIESIFEGLLNKENEMFKREEPLVFKKQLKQCLSESRRILEKANDNINENNEGTIWTEVIKKICAKFQLLTIQFISAKLDGASNELIVKKKLTQRVVIATVIVETQFGIKLCKAHNVCANSYECTKALNTLLESFKTLPEEKVKNFVRSIHEVLLQDSGFYSLFNEGTVNEFQVILNDMSYSNDVSSKEILLAIQKSVDERLKTIKSNTYTNNGGDIQLIHIILSDMDFFYSKHKVDPFHHFFNSFFDWVRNGNRLNSDIRQFVKGISYHLTRQSDLLIRKLKNEVKVFLEITIDPEK